VVRIAKFILHVAQRARMQRAVRTMRTLRRHASTSDARAWGQIRSVADQAAV
jgi:hypothetical protein